MYRLPILGARGFGNRLSGDNRYDISVKLTAIPSDACEAKMSNAGRRDIGDISVDSPNRPRGRNDRSEPPHIDPVVEGGAGR